MLTEALRFENVALGSFADSHHVVNLLGRPFLALRFNTTEVAKYQDLCFYRHVHT